MIAFSDYQDCHQAILCERTEVQTCKLGRNFADPYVQAYFTRDTLTALVPKLRCIVTPTILWNEHNLITERGASRNDS
jgi:hypothetical protein